MRKPRIDTGAAPKGDEVYFYDKIENSDMVIALFPVFLVFIFLLNLIA